MGLKALRTEENLELRRCGIRKTRNGFEFHMAGRDVSQEGHQDFKIFVELKLSLVQSLLVQGFPVVFPRIGVGSFHLKDCNVKEVC